MVIIAFSCNDFNGNYTGILEAIDIADTLKLITDSRIYINFDHGNHHVKISHRRFPYKNYQSWHGNWCWDAVVVTPEVAVDIINYVAPRCHTEEAEEGIWKLLKGNTSLTVEDLKRAMEA